MNKTSKTLCLLRMSVWLFLFASASPTSHALDLSLRDNFGKKSQFDTSSYSSSPSSSSYNSSYSSGSSYISPAFQNSMANLGEAMGNYFSAAIAAQARANAQRQQGLNINKQGNVYFKSGDWATAINYYENALRYVPRDHVIQNNLKRARGNLLNQKGVALHDQGDYAGAIAYYKQALVFYPEDSTIRRNFTLAEKAISREKFRQEEATLKEKMEKAKLKLLPSISEIFTDLAPPGNEPMMLAFEDLSNLRNAPASVKTQTLPIKPMPRGNLDLDPGLSPKPRTPWKPYGSTKAGDQLKAAFREPRKVPGLSNADVHEKASVIFDTQGSLNPSASLPEVSTDFKGVRISGGANLPPISKNQLKNPILKPFAKKWQAADQKLRVTEKKLSDLNAKPNKTSSDFVEIAKTKQELTNTENQIYFIRYQIRKVIQKQSLPIVKPAAKERTKTPPMPSIQEEEELNKKRIIMIR